MLNDDQQLVAHLNTPKFAHICTHACITVQQKKKCTHTCMIERRTKSWIDWDLTWLVLKLSGFFFVACSVSFKHRSLIISLLLKLTLSWIYKCNLIILPDGKFHQDCGSFGVKSTHCRDRRLFSIAKTRSTMRTIMVGWCFWSFEHIYEIYFPRQEEL